jgi:hypothetical protein
MTKQPAPGAQRPSPTSAALLVLAAVPIGRDALNGWLTIGISIAALPLLIAKRINTLWIVAGAAALSFTCSMIGVAQVRHAPAATTTSQHAADYNVTPGGGGPGMAARTRLSVATSRHHS